MVQVILARSYQQENCTEGSMGVAGDDARAWRRGVRRCITVASEGSGGSKVAGRGDRRWVEVPGRWQEGRWERGQVK